MNNFGEITVYWGSMFCGKTTVLIEELVSAAEGAICFKPRIDNRSGDDVIRTHDGVEFPVTTISSAEEILFLLDEEVTTIGIDEASLFLDDPSLIYTLEMLRDFGYKVIVTGLDLTAEDEPFGQMGVIASIADNCIKLRTNCNCGNLASLSRYKGSDKSDVVKIGGSEQYEPVCRTCFYKKD